MSHHLPPAALLVAHKVADYDDWKKAFDGHTQARKDAGTLGHDVSRGLDDDKMVYIYCPASDIEKVRTFLESPDLGDVMKESGVVGEPMVKLMKPMSAEFSGDPSLPGIVVIQGVENYDAWRKVYDEIDEFRKSCGITSHAVNQEWGRANQVIIYHQAKHRDDLDRFLDSNELQEAMQRGGVSGPPEVHFVRSCDTAEY